MKFYTNPSDKKWAVLYGTWCGSTRDAAVWISEGMGRIADVFDARENPDLSDFDYIIIGGAIRAQQLPPELQAYISDNQEMLRDKIRGYFVVCGNMRRPTGPEQVTSMIDNHLAKLCDVQGVPARAFNGRITKSLFEPELVERLKNMPPPAPGDRPRPSMLDMEDYDMLSRDDCMAFGQMILESTK